MSVNLRKAMILSLVLITALTNLWSVHIIAQIPSYPYAMTEEYFNFLGVAWTGILAFLLWPREKE